MELEWMRKYEQMQEQLSGSYREVFAAAKGYGVMTNAAPELLTDRLTELYDLLLTAQAEGCAVQRVVGKDTEVFCKEFFAESSPLRRLGTLAGRLYRYVWVLFLLEGLPLLAADSAPNSKGTNLLPYLLGVGVALIFELLARFALLPFFFRHKQGKPERWNYLAMLGFGGMVIGILALERALPWELSVPQLPVLIASGAYIAVFFVLRALRRYRTYGTILDERKQLLKDSYYRNLNSKAPDDAIILKSFRRQWKRLSRRKNMTRERFIQITQRNDRISDAILNCMPYIWFAWLLQRAARDMRQCDTLWDQLISLLVAVIAAAIFLLLLRAFMEGGRIGSAARKRVLQELAESGQSVPDFVAARLSKQKSC